MPKDDIESLEEEILERQERLRELRLQPMKFSEAKRLAEQDPIKFNRQFDELAAAGKQPIKYEE